MTSRANESESSFAGILIVLSARVEENLLELSKNSKFGIVLTAPYHHFSFLLFFHEVEA